jgi:hypothetical protein
MDRHEGRAPPSELSLARRPLQPDPERSGGSKVHITPDDLPVIHLRG